MRDLLQSMNLILQGSCDCLASLSSPMHCRDFVDNALPPDSDAGADQSGMEWHSNIGSAAC